jgi:uncharacterized SAM-binding protein YcdF (DUF218 family)
MASPFLESLSGTSSWPLQWVRLLKDFSFDLGCVAVLGLIVQWFVPGLLRWQRFVLLVPVIIIVLAGAYGMPEFWAKPIIWKAEQLSQEGCRGAPSTLVVLGGGMAGAEDLAVSTVSRVRHAARWMSVLTPEQRSFIQVVLSGGPSLPGVSRAESELMKEAFRAWRPEVPESNIVIETASLNTHDNGIKVVALLGEKSSRQAVALVTSWLHMPRALGVFRGLGVNACPVPSPAIEHSSEGFLNFRNGERTVRVLNEYAGFIGYRFMGWLK